MGTSKDTTTSGIDNTQVAKNDGNVAEDLNIVGRNSENWTLASSLGSDQDVHEFCISGTGAPDPCDASPTWNPLTTSYQSLVSNSAVNGTERFDLRISVPNTTSSYAQPTVDVTVQAVQH